MVTGINCATTRNASACLASDIVVSSWIHTWKKPAGHALRVVLNSILQKRDLIHRFARFETRQTSLLIRWSWAAVGSAASNLQEDRHTLVPRVAVERVSHTNRCIKDARHSQCCCCYVGKYYSVQYGQTCGNKTQWGKPVATCDNWYSNLVEMGSKMY